MVKKVDQVKNLESELADWRGKKARFEAEQQAAEAACTEATAAREALLLAARAEGDKVAQRALDENTAIVVRAEREVKDLTTVLSQIDGKLAGLEHAHRTAQRAEAAATLRELAAQRVQVDAQIVQALDALRPALVAWLRLGADMEALASRWDFPNGEAYARRFTLATYLATTLPPGLISMRTPLSDHRVDDLVAADREALDTLLGRLEASKQAAAWWRRTCRPWGYPVGGWCLSGAWAERASSRCPARATEESSVRAVQDVAASTARALL